MSICHSVMWRRKVKSAIASLLSTAEVSMPLTTLLRCNDLADTASFYREVLGFTVAKSAESTITVSLEDCRLTFTQAASTPPAASTKLGRAPRHRPQPHTSPPTLAVARTPQAVRADQKFCSAVAHPVARKARLPVCLGACRGWARRWRVRCSKRRSRGGRSKSSGQRRPGQRGHRAHSCRGCFRRPASSPAAGPEPA